MDCKSVDNGSLYWIKQLEKEIKELRGLLEWTWEEAVDDNFIYLVMTDNQLINCEQIAKYKRVKEVLGMRHEPKKD